MRTPPGPQPEPELCAELCTGVNTVFRGSRLKLPYFIRGCLKTAPHITEVRTRADADYNFPTRPVSTRPACYLAAVHRAAHRCPPRYLVTRLCDRVQHRLRETRPSRARTHRLTRSGRARTVGLMSTRRCRRRRCRSRRRNRPGGIEGDQRSAWPEWRVDIVLVAEPPLLGPTELTSRALRVGDLGDERHASHMAALGSRSAIAGPWMTWPSMSNREPWQGQSHDRSAVLNVTRQPRWVQVAATACRVPSSSR
jgi:hypothetical protein